MRWRSARGFSFIELLIVMAIIAVLATVTIFIFNPPELSRQSRDSNRVSDLHTIQQAINLYSGDAATAGQPIQLGNASTVYLSLPDSSATCGSYALPALPTGYAYHCAPVATYRNTNGTGWIPIDFASTSFGSYTDLPIDPANSTSSCSYYEYVTNGKSFAIAAAMESQKEQAAFTTSSQNYSGLLDLGSDQSLIPVNFASACASTSTQQQQQPPAAPTLPLSGSLSMSNQFFQFSGTAGESINIAFLNVSRSGNCPVFTLVTPASSTIENTTNCGGGFAWNDVILPSTGTYTVFMNPEGGTASAQIYLSDSLSYGNIPLETATQFANQVYGQYATATFTGTAGEQITFNVMNGVKFTDNCPNFQIWSPSGTNLTNNTSCGGELNWQDITLPNDGTYMLKIWPGDSKVTSTVFFSTPAATTTIPFETYTTLANQYPGQYFTGVFTGSANEQITFNVMNGVKFTHDCPNFQIWSPSGTNLTNNTSCGGELNWQNITLPNDGTYVLRIWPGDSLVTSTVFFSTPAATTTIPFETNTVLANQYTGQYLAGVFTGTAGEQITFNVLNGVQFSHDCPNFQIWSPSGTNLTNNTSCGGEISWQDITLPNDGTYVLRVWPGDSKVTSTVFFSTPAATTTIPFETPTVLANQYTGQYFAGVFTGSANEQITFNIFNGVKFTHDCPYFQLVNPAGAAIQGNTSCGGDIDWQDITLPSDGTYTLKVWPGDSLVTSTVFFSTPAATTTIPFETNTVLANQYAGQYFTGVFTGSANEQITFNVLNGVQYTHDCPYFQLVNPAGAAIQGNTSCGGDIDWQDITLPNDGTYVLKVWPGDSLVTSTVFFSTPLSGTLPFESSTVVANNYIGQYTSLTFTGSLNELINLAVSGVRFTHDCPYFQIVNPAGAAIQGATSCGGWLAWNNLNLSTAGTYTLKIWPGDSLVTSTITLSDSANLGTIAVNTNTTMSNGYPGQYVSMTFSGTAGQVVKFSGSGIARTDGCPTFYLINPSGGTVESTAPCGSTFAFGSTTLPTTGTYTVSMNPGDSLVTSTLYLAE